MSSVVDTHTECNTLLCAHLSFVKVANVNIDTIRSSDSDFGVFFSLVAVKNTESLASTYGSLKLACIATTDIVSCAPRP